jgi:hypothetical protein
VELTGTILLPFSFLVGAMPFALFAMLMFLAVGYGTLLSMGSVLLAEATVRRYPGYREVLVLILFALVENFGYRQMITFFRAQGVFQYFFGSSKWEVVTHRGMEPSLETGDA